MYRSPFTEPRRFSIEDQARSAAKSYLILGCLIAIVHLGVAGWLLADHLGFVRRFLSSEGAFLRSEVLLTLIAWATLPISLAYLFIVWRRARRGEAPRIFARLARYGEPTNVAAEIEREVNADAESEHAGSVSVTRSWFVHQHTFGFDALPLSEIVWAHAVLTTYKVNGVNVGRTRGLAVYTRSEARSAAPLSISCTEEDGSLVLQILLRRLPWIWTGHTPALAERWASDRAAMIAEADQLRTSHSGGSPARA